MKRYGYSFVIAIGAQAATSTQTHHDHHRTLYATTPLQGIDDPLTPVVGTRFLRGRGGSRGSRGGGSRGSSRSGGGGGGMSMSKTTKTVLGGLGAFIGLTCFCSFCIRGIRKMRQKRSDDPTEDETGNDGYADGPDTKDIPTAVTTMEPEFPKVPPATAQVGSSYVPPAAASTEPYVPEPYVPGRLEGMLQTDTTNAAPEAGLNEPLLAKW